MTVTNPRGRHTATLLSGGGVLIEGGASGVNGLNSAEVYNPSTGAFSTTSTPGTNRDFHTATCLPSGKVLFTGGRCFPTSAALFDPTTGTFSPTGSLATGRYNHTATLRSDGTVLIAGGERFNANGTQDAFATTEIYNPATGTFIAGTPMSGPRYGHSATLLSDGTLLVAGGSNGKNALASAELC